MMRTKKPDAYAVGTLVFIPSSAGDYSRVWVVARTNDKLLPGKVRHICHRVDLNTGLPMACPDERCKGKGRACCAITINGGWYDDLHPLTAEEVRVYSTGEHAVLDREFAKECGALVPDARTETKTNFATFLDSLLNAN